MRSLHWEGAARASAEFECGREAWKKKFGALANTIKPQALEIAGYEMVHTLPPAIHRALSTLQTFDSRACAVRHGLDVRFALLA